MIAPPKRKLVFKMVGARTYCLIVDHYRVITATISTANLSTVSYKFIFYFVLLVFIALVQAKYVGTGHADTNK